MNRYYLTVCIQTEQEPNRANWKEILIDALQNDPEHSELISNLDNKGKKHANTET